MSKQQKPCLDKFYTRYETAIKCYDFIKPYINSNTIIVEPSAGSGVFVDIIAKDGYRCIPLDISPDRNDIIQMNFFDYIYPGETNIITFGNPPFGKNSSLAKKFFNKAILHSDYVCFILPRTFMKENMKDSLYSKCELIFEYILEQNSFEYNGQIFDVPCCFQIWKRTTSDRIKMERYSMSYDNFKFNKIWTNKCISFQRVGCYAGKISYIELNKQSHYFIETTSDVIEFLEKQSWENIKYNTSGNPSIGKQEIIKILIDNNIIRGK